MASKDVAKFADLILSEMEPLLAEWRSHVRELPSARALDVPTLNDHVPLFLRQLAGALRLGSTETIPESVVETSPVAHGIQRVRDGYDIGEVVAEYNLLRSCLHRLAERHGLALQGTVFEIVNVALNEAVVVAVQSFATGRALEVQQRREEYLAFVAHDLRTPLNAIALAARVLEISLGEDSAEPEVLRMFRALRRNVRTLEELVQKVLEENAHLQTEVGVKVQRRRFDLWPLVEALIHDLHPVAGTDSTRLRNAVPPDLVVCADANLLRRVFQNLIANAIRYTPAGEIEIGAVSAGAGGEVEVWVRDNGAGIAADLLEEIFEKGATDAAEEGGLGLGLTIVKAFVEAHGGKVSVESTPGAGSTFRFVLPG